MPFTYQPKTAEEIAAMALLSDGAYPFEIVTCSDAPSKTSGKEMLTLGVIVYGEDGAQHTIKDYIVPGSPWADKKLFELCAAVGLGAKYATGQLCALDFEGKQGWCTVGTEKGKEKADGSGSFPDKNRIKWYMKDAPDKKPGEEASAAPAASGASKSSAPKTDIDEDVPF